MNKKLDKLKKKIYINKNLFVFLLGIIIIGIASGTIFSIMINNQDKILVKEYLETFMDNIVNERLNSKNTLLNTIILKEGYVLLLWALGISIFGIILDLPLLFIKSFILGFSVGSIIINFKLKGILIMLLYIMPHHIINILIYILIAAYSIMLSYRIIKSIKNKQTLNFKTIIIKYRYILLFSVTIIFFTSLYETYIMPKMLKFILILIK